MNYYATLFNENEAICVSVTPKGTAVYPLSKLKNLEDFSYVCINPLYPELDKHPTEDWHKENKPRRADHNVTAYRNILIEMDKMELNAQINHILSIELPFSTCVFSGGKSYHWIISLEEPLATRTEYNRLVSRIYTAVGNDIVDKTCKNPSRLSRIPGHLRKDTGKIQELLYARGRVKNEKIEQWLLSKGVKPIENSQWEDITYKPLRKKDIGSLSGATRNFLLMGAYLDTGWNFELFRASADLCRNGWELNEAREMFRNITGHLDQADEKTIKSAYNNERNKEK